MGQLCKCTVIVKETLPYLGFYMRERKGGQCRSPHFDAKKRETFRLMPGTLPSIVMSYPAVI